MAQAPTVAAAGGSVYSIRAEAALPDGTVFIREAMAGVTSGVGRKVKFFSWREGQAAPKPILPQPQAMNLN